MVRRTCTAGSHVRLPAALLMYILYIRIFLIIPVVVNGIARHSARL